MFIKFFSTTFIIFSFLSLSRAVTLESSSALSKPIAKELSGKSVNTVENGNTKNLSNNDDNPAEIPDIIIGSPNAKTTLIEYSSINCMHCALFHARDFPTIKSQLIDTGLVRYIYRHFPLDGQAVLAMGVISMAPEAQWFDKICIAYQKIGEWINEDPIKLAQLCNINNKDCQNIKKQKALLDRIIAKRYNAEKKYDIPSTPQFIIVRDNKEEVIKDDNLNLVKLMQKLKQ